MPFISATILSALSNESSCVEAQLSDAGRSFEPCRKDMHIALSFPNGRHFFVEHGVLKLTVATAPVAGGGEAVLERNLRFCPFCGRSVQGRSESVGPWGRLRRRLRI
jgi:hypothetical protein